ncbi:DUF1330 domain-containing protein [Sulfitobacter donghicola]|uniref:DUF1330 domain-containing protein n=1 Tax=Sulfitobacter donghicola DSW-25 = KCTC 12864 = JCM 14565 TaxID=1300350 RepID=A0A073IK95_9RHOB|nr:DUF1330 domain-containing protein [Sulfitobacter donghicola]KEJ89985.1 hypothetical protein DSW25_07165 [Sulfitobacter donghicola DSW-25 = KCTC 12864 = JCM 14565]KIN66885.1 DUF1330 domain containing protein [Sulfitobacter donghicola DSW-25 = KCTC 12864 = JCM 14565]
MPKKGYWIGNVDVRDAEVYDKYRAANAKPFADYNAKFLARGGTQQIREGNAHSRTVVIEFPSYADAVACYESPAYQAAKDIRMTVSDGNLIIIEGYDG